MRMMDQNGSKFTSSKIVTKLRFIQIEIFFRTSSLGEIKSDEKIKKIDVMGTLRMEKTDVDYKRRT